MECNWENTYQYWQRSPKHSPTIVKTKMTAVFGYVIMGY